MKNWYALLCTALLFLACQQNDDDVEPTIEACKELEYNGYTYDLIQIGDQCWFAENLQTTAFDNGDSVAEIIGNDDWHDAQIPARCKYDNDPMMGDIFGMLYNFAAANDPRNLCPSGWHVPDSADMASLIEFAGPTGADLMESGTVEEGLSTWNEPNDFATNSTGFSLKGGGVRAHYLEQGPEYDGAFLSAGISTMLWMGEEVITNSGAYRYPLLLFNRFNDTLSVAKTNYFNQGAYVRCLQD